MSKGRRNKVLKLTPAKIKYIIRAKTNNISSRIIAAEMKISVRTVNRIWSYWMKNKKPWAPKKFGRPKKILSESDTCLILKISLMGISDSFDVVEASTKSKILERGAWKR
jgi:hypothetical protein